MAMFKEIKVITLWQPWASLIMIGAKPWEFRSWNYATCGIGVRIGDTIGIHAGARPTKPAEVRDLLARLDDEDGSTGLIPDLARPLLERLMSAHKCMGIIEHSALLGTATIGKPILSCDLKPEWAALINDSDRLEHCNWAWPMSDISRFDEPIKINGHQGFWNFSMPTELWEHQAGIDHVHRRAIA
jgi:hypothetical protein